MSELQPVTGKNTLGRTEYATSWEHISDELARLDIRIRLQFLKQCDNNKNRKSDGIFGQLRGMAISGSEIVQMLEEDTENCQYTEEIRALKAELKELDSRIESKRAASAEKGVYLALAELSQLLKLTHFEEQCIVICLAIELDRKYQKLFAILQDDMTLKKPCVDFVLTLLCESKEERIKARRYFDAEAPLPKYILCLTDGASGNHDPLISRVLKLEERIVNFLLGYNHMDSGLTYIVNGTYARKDTGSVYFSQEKHNKILKFVELHFSQVGKPRENVIFYFYGPDGYSKRQQAETLCNCLDINLIIADTVRLLENPAQLTEILLLLERETILLQSAIYFEDFDCLSGADDTYSTKIKYVLESIAKSCPLTFLSGESPGKVYKFVNGLSFIEMEFEVPPDRTRKELWEEMGKDYKFASDIDFDTLAGKFRFTPGKIKDTLFTAQELTRWRSNEDSRIGIKDLHAACRMQSSHKLGTLAQKLKPKYTWRDIVLLPDQVKQLEEICNQVKYRQLVNDTWGFGHKLSYGKGVNALFSGPPGTGKTMAAEVIANELDLDLYKIDLAQVVSKYIGETEKNLQKIFREASESNAILFFDEADALFGKRSEIKDAHDRYANVEIAFLLQKMEEYDGITILATNLFGNIDSAFIRRIQFVIEFSFPDEEYRKRIWEVTFPSETPLDKGVDFDLLASEIRLSGGNIKNIALAAAFLAAKDKDRVKMAHLLQAARREHQKLNRSWNESNLSRRVLEK
ncbi:MAG: AAA family ATPase [Clostridia bacterium]|nr:AAA family ATPase [Clostridia bacterium]